MHFLGEIPRIDAVDRQPDWLKWGFLLTWQPKVQTSTAHGPSAAVEVTPAAPTTTAASHAVTLIVFQPPVETLERLIWFVRSPDWTDATLDPYVLVDIALFTWHQRIDKVAWEVTDLIRADEKDIFHQGRTLRSTGSAAAAPDLHRIHSSAKNAILMLETLDAAIRLVDMAMTGHESLVKRAGSERVWENTHRILRHRGELFQSTRLRTASSQARIKNTVDLVGRPTNFPLK